MIIKRQQLVEQVVEHLHNAVSSGVYAVGQRIPAEPDLMKELGVGRSTLREAVRVLAHSGVFEVRQGAGTYVRGLPEDTEPLMQRLRRARIREVMEVRRILETETVRLAAIRRKEKDVKRIRGFLKLRQASVDKGDLAAALDADTAFHGAIAEAAGNEVLAELYRAFSITLTEALAGQWEVADSRPSETAQLHFRLLDAIEKRDAAAAVSATTALLDRHDSTK